MPRKPNLTTGARAAALPGLLLLLTLPVVAAVSTGEKDDATEDSAPAAERSTLYETATVRARPIDTAVATVTVLEREEIESLNVLTVGELLRYMPGLDVTTSGARGGLATAQVRGGDPNFTVVLLDGVPLNDATDQLRGGAVNLNSLSTVHVERIEVVRGALSSFFGSTALGGAINIITRRGAAGNTGYGLALAAGDDSVARGAGSLWGGTQQRRHFVGVTWEREEERIADDEFEQWAVHGNADIEIGGARLDLAGRLTSWEGDDYPDASGGPVFGSGETRHSEHDEASLRAGLTLGEGERRHHVTTTLYRHDLERTSPDIVIVPASEEETEYTNARAGWSHSLPAPERVRLDVGVEAGWEKGENESTLFFGGFFGDVDASYEDERTTGAAFVELFAERGRLVVEAGARVDVPEGFGSEISPRAGIGYRIGEHTRLRASGARGFKLPSFFVLASPPALGGNPDLDPELALSFEVGLDRRFESANVDATLVAFRTRYEDLIDFDFATFGFVNRAEVDAEGAELSVDWRPSARFELSTNATYQEVDDRETDQRLRNRPEWIGAARLVWRPLERLRLVADGQWVSESVDAAPTVPGRDSTAGYQLYGVAATWTIAERWELNARVHNVGDKEYETFIGFPGPERGYRVGVRYRSGAD
jgi:outer membrane cobalamin receptor